ncbi:MAG: hypothetical protein RL095_2337 [Verrucomicrobiota bacterium]|jgi:hypothetical protein
MPLFIVKNSRRDLGHVLDCPCSKCGKETPFHLHQLRAISYLFSLIPLPTQESWSFECRLCANQLPLTSHEIETARRHLLDRIGTPSPAALELPSVAAQRSAKKELLCQSCGEKSPGTFACCWKCSSPLEGAHVFSGDEADPTLIRDNGPTGLRL